MIIVFNNIVLCSDGNHCKFYYFYLTFCDFLIKIGIINMNRNDLLKSGIKRMTQILLSLLMISVPLLGQSKSTFIKQFEYDDENGQWGNPMVVNDSILIVAYSGYKGFGNVQTLKIAAFKDNKINANIKLK